MRQAGYLAAAALHALDHHRHRLKDDHDSAAHIASRLRALSAAGRSVEVQYPEPGTNMVYFRVHGVPPDVFVRLLAERGVRMLVMAGGWLRAVTHLDVSRADVEQATSIICDLIPR